MPIDRKRLVFVLAGFQVADAIACAVPVAYIKADLDRIGCPDEVQRALPAIKAASAIGLVAGLRMRRVGVVTAAALVAYFASATTFHVLAHDPPIRSVPAVGIGAWAAALLLSASD